MRRTLRGPARDRAAWWFGLAAMLAVAPLSGAALAQTAPQGSSTSAQDLKAAIADIKRRVEQQRQAAGQPAASDAAEDLRGARDRIEGLARTMSELRAERDSLRGQLLQARDDLARAQAGVAALEEERAAASSQAGERVAALESELAAARAQAGELATVHAEAVAAAESARQALEERERRLAAAEQEITALQEAAATREAATRALSAEAEGLRGRTGELETELARVKAEAEAGRAETERRLVAEVEALKARLGTVEQEAAELRAVAASSVEEVRSLSEQLLATMAEKDKLIAASVELSSSEALQALQLAAREEGEAGTVLLHTVAPGAGEEAVSPATFQLAAPAPEPEAGESWSKTVLEGNLFAAGNDRLSTTAAIPLANVAKLIREAEGAVRIVGHTDSNGDAEPNRRLSLRRAQSVRDYLIATYDFPPARFTVDGMGEEEPIASNDTAAGRRANRRVEVFVAR